MRIWKTRNLLNQLCGYSTARASSLTSDLHGSSFSPLGVVAVKQHRRMLILFLLAGVLGGSAIPPLDLPETTFDESDAPVNLAPPSQITLQLVSPVIDPLRMRGLPFHCAECVVSAPALAVPAMRRDRLPRTLQDFLCTFLM